MTLYQANFHGRKTGAIGVTSNYTRFIEATSEELARLKVYAQYEHIDGGLDGIRIREIKPANR